MLDLLSSARTHRPFHLARRVYIAVVVIALAAAALVPGTSAASTPGLHQENVPQGGHVLSTGSAISFAIMPRQVQVASRPTERVASTSRQVQTVDVTVTVDRSSPVGVSRLDLGVTHMQYSLDPWGDPTAVAQGKALLTQAVRYQNQHIYGFGAANLNPAPGVYDWQSLDQRIALIRSMGATPVITLCCAPDWMTSLGSATSTYPLLPPTPQHYADFADLARRVALRYPDVKYYQVWNEMKGFWNPSTNNWDYVAYTTLYNQVYDALKGVDPTISVGGPYLVIEGTGSSLGDWSTAAPISSRNLAVIDYWLASKHGADFITVDRSVVDSHDTHSYTQAELLNLTSWFGSVTKQLAARTNLPIWWAEDYFVGANDWGFQAAGFASILYNELRGGASVSLRWQPQGIGSGAFGGNDQNLFSDTRLVGGGQPFPTYPVYKAFHDGFGPGTTLYKTTSSSPDVEVLASASKTLLINMRSVPVNLSVNGALLQLRAHEVRVLG